MIRGNISIAATAAIIGSFVVAIAGAPAHAAPACSSSAQDEYNALRVAKACQAKVEILAATTDRVKVYANADGTQTMESYAVPQRVRKDGAWKDIDTKLQRGKDGRWAPKASGLDVSFSNGGEEPFAQSLVDGKRFELSWPSALPEPKVDGDTATYQDVMAGVDLAVRATRGGFTHVLVVKTAEAAANPAVAKARYRVSGEVTARNAADGTLELADAAGNALSVASRSSDMWDSAMDPAVGGEVLPGVTIDTSKISKSTAKEPGDLAHVHSVEVKAEGADLYVIPDASLLKTGTLPIYIDPPWETPKSTWVYATNNNTNGTSDDVARVGQNPTGGVLFRSFFTFPLSGLYGKQTLSASMHITVDHTAACAGNTAYMYRTSNQTGSAGARVGWSPALGVQLGSAWADSNEAGGCGSDQGDDPVIFGNNTTMRDNVDAAATATGSVYTVGLCMCTAASGSNESGTYQWMKFFHATAKLVTTYNTVQGTPTNLTTAGAACGATIATLTPTLQAQYVDTDGSDTLTGTFEWQELPSGTITPVTGPSKPANNYGSINLSLPTSAEGKSYQWRITTKDPYSPSGSTSSWCGFTVNTGPPPTPGVSSTTDYPNDGLEHGGPGIAGNFTFTNGGTTGTDITSYVYGWTDPPTNTVTVAPGASATVKVTPPRFGYNTLHVYSQEPSLIKSTGTAHYQFLVTSPSAPIAHWPLDQINAVDFNAAIGPNLTVESGRTDVTWSPDVRYMGSPSAAFDVVAETPSNIPAALSAPLPALDTSKAFSVSAWVRPSVVPSANSMVLGKDGTDAGGFYFGLYYSGAPATPKWAFGIKENSASSSLTRFASSPNTFTTADVGKWVHLAGTYDPAEKKLRLFVNGVLQPEADSGTTPWNATGNLSVGRAFHAGGVADLFKGHIADVRVWNRVLVADDLAGTNENATAGTHAVPGILQPVQVGTWNYNDYDSIDGAYWGRHMTLHGNATYADPGHDANTALNLDGTAGTYADTAGPVLRTDNSHTISMWVRPTLIPTSSTTLMRQGSAGSSASKLELRSDGKLTFSIVNDNGDGTYTWKASVSNAAVTAGAWVHVTGVFDLGKQEVRLYINGVEQTTKGTGAVGHNATGAMVLGTDGSALLFSGDIDQLKVYAGAMNQREVTNLYNS